MLCPRRTLDNLLAPFAGLLTSSAISKLVKAKVNRPTTTMDLPFICRMKNQLPFLSPLQIHRVLSAGDSKATMAGRAVQEKAARKCDKSSSSDDLFSSCLLGRPTSKKLATCWILGDIRMDKGTNLKLTVELLLLLLLEPLRNR